ncbi:MAG: hypothetical protein H6661_03115 [Ardenticatenaceae bacterium]|nr:hypothetical protein [Ardenticatenaceae bacterium]
MNPPIPERLYIHPDHITYSQYYALDEDNQTIVALQILGPEQAVKAAWAKLVTNGKQSAYIDSTPILLDGSKMHITMKAQLPNCGWLEMWLIHKQATHEHVSPGNAPYFYVFSPDTGDIPEDTRKSHLLDSFVTMLDQVIGTPILPNWGTFLLQQGANSRLVSTWKLPRSRNTNAYRIRIVPDKWQQIISSGLKSNQITF